MKVLIRSLLSFLLIQSLFSLTAFSSNPVYNPYSPYSPVIPDNDVYDMDALTSGQDDSGQDDSGQDDSGQDDSGNKQNPPTNKNTEKTFDGASLTFAECLIMEQLEIKDPRCDRLQQVINCPEYTICIQDCGNSKDSYKACLAVCEQIDPKCTQKYPISSLLPKSDIEILDARGDARITYDDNPTPADMQSVSDEAEIKVGATVFTGSNGSFTLRFGNNASAAVGPDSYFRIDNFFESDKFEGARTYLKNGSVKINVNLTKEDKNVKYAYVVLT
ncbi:hypothetical protein HY605_01705, partial [Candidatus Peregrinibacteria bacterium]|nr:hypothetical protein [Candidatus Peregrinibacteria bacterium]